VGANNDLLVERVATNHLFQHIFLVANNLLFLCVADSSFAIVRNMEVGSDSYFTYLNITKEKKKDAIVEIASFYSAMMQCEYYVSCDIEITSHRGAR
jgi:hypothetical protein